MFIFLVCFYFILISLPKTFADKIENSESIIINNTKTTESEIFTKNNNVINNKRKLEDDFKPINIYIDKSYLTSQLQINSEEDNLYLINQCIDKAKTTIEKIFKVKKNKNKIIIYHDDFDKLLYFNKNYTDQSLIGRIIENDLVIFIRMSGGNDNMDIRNNEIFGRSQIIKNDVDGRPMVGYVILGYHYIKYLETDFEQKKELISSILLHEFIHVLGFIEENGFNKFPNKEEIFGTKRVERIEGNIIEKKIVKSDTILNFAKIYFNCSTIDSIEFESLENEEGIANSHWEGRILLGDIMTSKIYFQEQVISEFTLLLLEESGWYETNKYTGGLMRFGKSQGCNFLNHDCINIDGDKAISLFPNDFCSSQSQSSCSSGRMSRGYCDKNDFPTNALYKRSNYEIRMEYDGEYHYYGYGDEVAEYCLKNVDRNKDIITKSYNTYYYVGNCKLGNKNFGKQIIFNNGLKNNDYNIFVQDIGEEYSDDSFCALSSILNKNDNGELYNGLIRPTCYSMNCSDSSLSIKINTEYIVCPRNGSLIVIESIFSSYKGYLFCPDYNLICTGTVMCNNIFDCVEKESMAKPNTFYYNYSQDITSEVLIPKEADLNKIPIKGYELSDNGICPKDCRHCKKINDNSQCILCRNNYYYLGTKENDENPITCNDSVPLKGYYLTNSPNYYPDKTYFKCIDNCYYCTYENPEICLQCAPTHKLDNNKKCVERIPKCILYDTASSFTDDETNGGAEGYKECLRCSNSENYFCVDLDKTKCIEVNDYNAKTYYNMEDREFSCIKKCSEQFDNCEECNKTKCIKCKEDKEYLINDRGICIEKLENCKIQRFDINFAQCLECKEDYYCINDDTKYCKKIRDSINLYYFYNYANPTTIKCIRRCNETHDFCSKCNKDACTECMEGYFIYEGRCIKNITGCINNSYDGNILECNECNKDKDYYCLNETKTICHNIDINDYLPHYYLKKKLSYPCYIGCNNLIDNCFSCNQTTCIECTEKYVINDAGDFCFVRPFIIPDNDNCTLKMIENDKTIYQIDPWKMADDYWINIPYVQVIDHYIGENFTSTVFVHSECTEDLFSEGYFKIDTKELEQVMIRESKTEGMKILFGVYINYNHKSFLGYYNLTLWYLDPNKLCKSCLDTDYNITRKFDVDLNDTLGAALVNLIYSENLDIVDKESDFYNKLCKNVTIDGIDIPLNKRLNIFYLHKYLDVIFCNSENCTIGDYSYENSTVTCKCRMGNRFEDILTGDKFEYKFYEDEPKKANEFVESLLIIKCVVNGFKWQNLKSNIGFLFCVIGIVSQICLFFYYYIYSKPIINANKPINMSSPPRKSILRFMTDWERNARINKLEEEEEVFVQPRDDADDLLLEEEKSFENDGNIIDISGLSIDTNVGGAFKNISTGNKAKEKIDQKRVLILLDNRGKNKSRNAEDLRSDSDIVPIPQDEYDKDDYLNYGKIYWHVLSLKQHIINYFSCINCLKITESYIPISIRLIRSIFMIFVSFVLNIICLGQTYYEKKLEHFNKEYTIINSATIDIKIPLGKKISYAIGNVFGKAMLVFVILLVIQFLLGIIFFSVRKGVVKARYKKSHKAIQDLISKIKKTNIIFFIIVMVLMFIFFLTIAAFVGAYGGGCVDYFTAGIISLIILEIFPFIWSLIIALLRYFGIKKNIKFLFKISQFFMF